MNSKVWIVAKREYLTRVQKKSFIIVTLLTPPGHCRILICDGLDHECRE